MNFLETLLKHEKRIKKLLQSFSNYFFLLMGLSFLLAAMGTALYSFVGLIQCLMNQCKVIISLLDFAGYLIISVAIFDVGRYVLEEEVFRDRELRSPREARQSLTKFMVIIVIAVTLEALLSVIRAGTDDISLLIYPAILFFVATLLLVGLGVFQRLSVAAEVEAPSSK